jgi:hypothetical protein
MLNITLKGKNGALFLKSFNRTDTPSNVADAISNRTDAPSNRADAPRIAQMQFRKYRPPTPSFV